MPEPNPSLDFMECLRSVGEHSSMQPVPAPPVPFTWPLSAKVAFETRPYVRQQNS